ncbi:hypothetical protein HDU67_000001 [Dinochytrium kinnereticum]|nr:hypothetical protein HDU67_000001 [Dinochytrium kinnereticum]
MASGGKIQKTHDAPSSTTKGRPTRKDFDLAAGEHFGASDVNTRGGNANGIGNGSMRRPHDMMKTRILHQQHRGMVDEKLITEPYPSIELVHLTARELARRALKAKRQTFLNPDEPAYLEAMAGPYKYRWSKAITEELNSLQAQSTWMLANLPPGQIVMRYQWVLKFKRDPEGEPTSYRPIQ